MTDSRTWRATRLPAARSRTDDIWFRDADNGWAVNSDGNVWFTGNGGAEWSRLATLSHSYLRCIAFADARAGWLGTLSGPAQLYATRDGGVGWTPVTNLPAGAPGKICGLSVVNAATVFASGTNYPNERAAVIRTKDGGATWQALDVPGATLLVDIFFDSPDRGWVVGGMDDTSHPGRASQRSDVVPAIFHTTNGGKSWVNLVQGNAERGEFPHGEWGWKFQKLNDNTLFVSCENFDAGAILRSDDGGVTWRRLAVNDPQRNANLEGIGFLDERRGWVGGWGDSSFQGGFTSATEDGGNSWADANHVGFRLNRFRFIGQPPTVAYASGDTVYKYSDEPVPPAVAAHSAARQPDATGDSTIGLQTEIPPGTRRLQVRIWERFGREVRLLVDESGPRPGPRELTWDFTDEAGRKLPPGPFIVRFTADDMSSSRIIHRLAKR